MEPSRVGSSHSPQGGSAPVRGKTMAKPSDEAAQEAARQGGFLALMAALEQSPEAGERLDLQPEDAGLVTIQGADLGMLMQMQGVAAGSILGTRLLPTEDVDAHHSRDFRESLGAGSVQTAVEGVRLSWSIDRPDGCLVAQTTALDGYGDVKDGVHIAAMLSPGRLAGTRATAALAQRGESLSAVAGSLSNKVLPGYLTKTLTSTADGLSVALTAASAASLRDTGSVSAFGAHALGSSPTSLGPIELYDTSVLTGWAPPVVPERGGEPAQLSDLGSTGAGYEIGAQEGAQVEVPLPALEAASSDAMASFAAEEALAEQVTYWVNQKVQSAEMTVSRDGQPVEVSVTLSGNEAQVAFRSDQEQTRQLLDASMAQLSEMLRGQGLVLSGASVGTSARDRRSSGESSQGRAPKAGQTTVVAAEGISVRANHIQTGRGVIDVFV